LAGGTFAGGILPGELGRVGIQNVPNSIDSNVRIVRRNCEQSLSAKYVTFRMPNLGQFYSKFVHKSLYRTFISKLYPKNICTVSSFLLVVMVSGASFWEWIFEVGIFAAAGKFWPEELLAGEFLRRGSWNFS
jgi:hypothetical protein